METGSRRGRVASKRAKTERRGGREEENRRGRVVSKRVGESDEEGGRESERGGRVEIGGKGGGGWDQRSDGPARSEARLSVWGRAVIA
eukprot:315153-Rhodomonas_salina.1